MTDMEDGYRSATSAGDLLWQPSLDRIEKSGLRAFRSWVNSKYQQNFNDYDSLWQWSVDNPETFWEAVWQYYDIAPGQAYQQVLSGAEMPGAKWFEGARVNFAQYLLRQGDRGDLSRTAVFAESESVAPSALSWADLREQVARLATHLRAGGVEPGDRIVAYMPMSAEVVVAMLACISVGAVWSSCSPDFGAKSVLERFAQIQPKKIFAVSGYRYNGRAFQRGEELAAIMQSLPSLTELIYLPWLDAETPAPPAAVNNCAITLWSDSLARSDVSYKGFDFEAMPFDAPLWIMYSSGTTGIPKGIVHSQGGVLIEFVKFAWLHDDVKPDSVKFFFTTTGWTMFNMLVSGMMAGSAIVVYDGSPSYPDHSRLWDICDRYQATYFGATPSYVNLLIQAKYSPREHFNLESVKTIALTGSPSAPETFAWFYQHVHQDLHVISMSGGTDICGAFVAGAVDLPVHAGEIQCACLGVDVAVFDEAGQVLPASEDGELVIRQPIPSMPLCFWADPQNQRYHDSYFADFPGTWRQGDLIKLTEHSGYVISGRSDSTLNRFGVRTGTAEIYRAVESLVEIEDSLIISLELRGARFFMPLFVVLQDDLALTDELVNKIAATLKEQCSPRHVPDKVYAIDEVPYTLTGKKLEVPVKKLLMGVAADKALNKGAIANPLAMDYFINLAGELQSNWKM
jgi:acetoacetyl-CoA synthetase